jgi:hypothetical protein
MLADTAERYLSTALFEGVSVCEPYSDSYYTQIKGIEAPMNAEEVALSNLTPGYQLE